MLVKGLPEMLMRQFEYEDPIVRGGKHLLHSAFFKELVALACDLVCTARLAFVVVKERICSNSADIICICRKIRGLGCVPSRHGAHAIYVT